MDHLTDITTMFPDLCGIYYLFSGPELVYIGQSKDILARVHKHKTYSPFYFDKVMIELCDDWKLDAYEIRAIKQYNPKHNKSHKPKRPMPVLFEFNPENYSSVVVLRKPPASLPRL